MNFIYFENGLKPVPIETNTCYWNKFKTSNFCRSYGTSLLLVIYFSTNLAFLWNVFVKKINIFLIPKDKYFKSFDIGKSKRKPKPISSPD